MLQKLTKTLQKQNEKKPETHQKHHKTPVQKRDAQQKFYNTGGHTPPILVDSTRDLADFCRDSAAKMWEFLDRIKVGERTRSYQLLFGMIFPAFLAKWQKLKEQLPSIFTHQPIN